MSFAPVGERPPARDRGHRQAHACRAPTVSATLIEPEMGAYVHGLSFPDGTKHRIMEAYQQARPEFAERDRQRQGIEGQLRRLGDLFVMGDLDKSEYEARRGPL